MSYQLTAHAQGSLSKRGIRLEWLEQVLRQPQLIQVDVMDDTLEHRLRRIDEFDGRVIVNPQVEPIRVITVFFDRAMRGKL